MRSKRCDYIGRTPGAAGEDRAPAPDGAIAVTPQLESSLRPPSPMIKNFLITLGAAVSRFYKARGARTAWRGEVDKVVTLAFQVEARTGCAFRVLMKHS